MNHTDQLPTSAPEDHNSGGASGHGWMMVVCCIPMLAIAVVLVATHVVSIAFLFYAVLCTAMMGGMMWAINHGGVKM